MHMSNIFLWYFQSANISDEANMVADDAKIVRKEADSILTKAEETALLVNGVFHNNFRFVIKYDFWNNVCDSTLFLFATGKINLNLYIHIYIYI